MIEPIPTSVTDAVAWAVVIGFLAAWAAEARRPSLSRALGSATWAVFAGFWLLLVPRFALVMRSPIETVLSAAAVPACLYVGLRLFRGERRSIPTLSRAVAVAGLVYLPFETIPHLRRELIEVVAAQTYAVITWFGFEVTLTAGPVHGYTSSLVFHTGGQQYMTYIVLACTGVGSISIFAGLIASLDAPFRRKARAFGIAVGVIWVLNIARNAFIAVAFGNQWFQILVGPILAVTGYGDPGLVSFFIADRVLSQSLSVVALVGITWLVVRSLPELLVLIEDVLYVITRREYDLHRALVPDA